MVGNRKGKAKISQKDLKSYFSQGSSGSSRPSTHGSGVAAGPAAEEVTDSEELPAGVFTGPAVVEQEVQEEMKLEGLSEDEANFLGEANFLQKMKLQYLGSMEHPQYFLMEPTLRHLQRPYQLLSGTLLKFFATPRFRRVLRHCFHAHVLGRPIKNCSDENILGCPVFELRYVMLTISTMYPLFKRQSK